MDDVAIIDALARSLQQAASQHDWPKVQKIDAQIASLLVSLNKQALTPVQGAAIDVLQQVHKTVYRYCNEQRDVLKTQMSRIRDVQEGSTAYAQFTSIGEMGR